MSTYADKNTVSIKRCMIMRYRHHQLWLCMLRQLVNNCRH